MEKSKYDIVKQLRHELLVLNGFPAKNLHSAFTLGVDELDRAFPAHAFPLAAIHDFISYTSEDRSATSAFVSCIAGRLTQKGGICAWISTSRLVFPAALASFNMHPDKVIFIDVNNERDALWVMEEALKCEQLSAVIGEIKKIDLTASRRLQLAVERSRVTGFLLRHQLPDTNPLATVSRWQITSLPSETEYKMPGVGFPRWNVELIKIRNGKPGAWQIEWANERFELLHQMQHKDEKEQMLQAG